MTESSSTASTGDNAFRYKRFRFFWCAVFAATFAVQIMSVSVGWQIYDMTRNPLFLGYVGLAQFMPALLLVLVTGLAADKFPRRGIMAVCLSVEVLCAGALFMFARADATEIWPIYVVLVTLGMARAFMGPAALSLAPNLVPTSALSSAVTANGAAWQLSNVVGPVAGGLLYGVAATAAYGTAAALVFLAVIMVILIPKPPKRSSTQATSMQTLLAGFRYIRGQKIVLGAISLDLFAVLLGGAVALMPVYARDILDVGPLGLGLLRAAPGVGGVVMAIILTRFPVRDHAGLILFGFVAAFGFFTIVFGLSTSAWIAIPALFMMGATDMVSVVLRETMIQLSTPDEVRGRVSAVNSVFIGASNELGEFRAGVVAAWIGAVWAVSLGGVGTMVIAGVWSQLFPELRKARHLDKKLV